MTTSAPSPIDPDALRAEADRLLGVVLPDSSDTVRYQAVRNETLLGWLGLLAAIDEAWDPDFDPEDVPLLHVLPPPDAGGVRFPPGVDPSALKGASARAEYEESLNANNAKAERYAVQTKLRRLEESLMPRVVAFTKSAFSAKEARKELKIAVEAKIKSPARQRWILSGARS